MFAPLYKSGMMVQLPPHTPGCLHRATAVTLTPQACKETQGPTQTKSTIAYAQVLPCAMNILTQI